MNIIGWSVVWEHKHGMDECSNAEVGHGDLEVQRSRGHDLHEDIQANRALPCVLTQ